MTPVVGKNWIHYDPERVDYSLTQSELDQLLDSARNYWKDVTLATGSLGIPCALNALAIYCDQQVFHATLPFFLNSIIGVVGVALATVFGIAWYKSSNKAEDLLVRIKGKPKLPVPVLTNVGELSVTDKETPN